MTQRKISKIGIIGEGKMGSSIFNYLVDFDFQLTWVCSPGADTDKIRRQFERKIKRSLETGIMDQKRYDSLRSTSISPELSSLSNCDLIIEAIPEDRELKRKLFLLLDTLVKSDAIFTSNASSINPSEISPPGGRAGQFAGLHFFYPVSVKNIVEFTVSNETTQETQTTLASFLDDIGRRYITLEEKNSFILNKIFLDVQNEASLIVNSERCSVALIDQLVRKHLFPFGVFDFCDSVGIDTMLAAVKNYIKDYPHKDYYSGFLSSLSDLASQGKLGLKTQEGFYRYPKEETATAEAVDSAEIVDHLRQTWMSAAKRFTALSHLPINDMNEAIKEYFGTETGPFG